MEKSGSDCCPFAVFLKSLDFCYQINTICSQYFIERTVANNADNLFIKQIKNQMAFQPMLPLV